MQLGSKIKQEKKKIESKKKAQKKFKIGSRTSPLAPEGTNQSYELS